jgi:formate hydrogenlyase transcriptional activator
LLLSEMNLDGLAVAVVESVHQILALDYAALALYDSSGGLRMKAQRGIAEAVRMTAAGQALAALSLQRNRLQVLTRDELVTLGAPAATLAEAGLASACTLPLATARGSLGALVVASMNTSAFSSDDVTLLHQLTTYAAIALQNAESFDEIKTLKDQIAQEKLYLEEEIRVDHNFADIIGESPAIKRVLQQIETVAPTNASVLILGETGTGKELLARALHQLSPRRDRTFVRLNAAAMPASLLESELFGHERGAFTGATNSRIGRMELAHRGTLFLDEVGDIPIEVQPKLLRVIQEKEFERLGSTRTQTTDVRLIAATNRDLQQMVAEGTFRSDLFYRLNVFPLQVPPLRDRHGDIPILVRYFCQKFSTRMKRRITTIPTAAMQALEEWSWPGNIRELENVIERAVIVSSGETLQLPPFQMAPPSEPVIGRTVFAAAPASPATSFADGEREIILRALRDAEGVIGGPEGAAARLGIKRTTLQSKMRKLGIRRPTF